MRSACCSGNLSVNARPPSPTMHAPTTTPPQLPHMPPPRITPAMHAPCTPSCHTCPPHLWTEFLTHACENITFPQLLLRTVTICKPTIQTKNFPSSFISNKSGNLKEKIRNLWPYHRFHRVDHRYLVEVYHLQVFDWLREIHSLD